MIKDKSNLTSPQVHKLKEIYELSDVDYLLVTLPDGKKRKLKYKNLKEMLLKDMYNKLKEIEDKMKELKVTKDTIIKAFKRSNSVSFGKPINILVNSSVEDKLKVGDIYCNGNTVKVKLKKEIKEL